MSLGRLGSHREAKLPKNLGSIVRIVWFLGVKKWCGFKEPTPLWEVEVVEGGRLICECETVRRNIPLRDGFQSPF